MQKRLQGERGDEESGCRFQVVYYTMFYFFIIKMVLNTNGQKHLCIKSRFNLF